MAEGYLQEDVEKGRTMEEVGAECLAILLQSSLLEKHLFRDCSTYQMHDLIHDLAQSISRECVGDKYPVCRNFLLGEKLKYRWNEKSMLVEMKEVEIRDKMLLEYKRAHVMHLYVGDEVQKLPDNVGKLIHVRSLTVSGRVIERLTESLCEFYNLQTLRLDACNKLQCLPHGLMNLISLRHLHIWKSCKFKMAPNMGRLTCLQTLKFFNVGEEKGHGIKELGSMENLSGGISIRNLEFVKGKEEGTLANLSSKSNLTSLELEWGWNSSPNINCEDEHVLEGLEPCSGLRGLVVTRYTGAQCPVWLGKLSALVNLELWDCKNVTELGSLNDIGFLKLKTLKIYRCCQLSSVPTSFPNLENVSLEDIQVSAVRDILDTNSLEDIRLCNVSGMRSLSDVTESSLSSRLKQLNILLCDDLIELPSSAFKCCRYLERLMVIECQNVCSCPLNLQQTPSLSTISITDCPKLDAKPRGFDHLTNLNQLNIGPFPDNSIHFFEWDGLEKGCSTTLQTLRLYRSSHPWLPRQLQYFSSLVHLELTDFVSMESLPDWFGKLTALQELHLWRCPKLQHLPMLAMKRLKNLRVLVIQECDLLINTQGDEITALPDLGLPNLEVTC